MSAPAGHVRLVLSSKPAFSLQIPLNIIESLCLKPCKYLVFLGWCVFGVEGVLAESLDGEEVDLDGGLDDKGVYYYLTNGHTCTDFRHAVDLEVIKQRTNVPSETTNTRANFRQALLERDCCCIWTGAAEEYGAGMHIIPFKRQSEWLQKIVENRPHYDEPADTLVDINDIRNGMFAAAVIHQMFDPRKVAILKTPNHILDTTDIPPRTQRSFSIDSVIYPRNERFTLQWLITPDNYGSLNAPNNIDATFKKHTRKHKPSDLLLHYNYGAAAVKHWGKGTSTFQKRRNIPRPVKPKPAPVGPTKTIHDRSTTIGKHSQAHLNEASGSGAARGGMVESGEDSDEAQWDEDDVMLFFWGNSPAATERHRKKQEENTQKMENWRKELEVPSGSV